MKDMSDFFSILLVNLFTTTDIIILIWALLTGLFCFAVRRSLHSVENDLRTSRRNASKSNEKITLPNLAELENQLQPKIEKLNKRYTLLINFISTFPLLGMLGTVKSLIGLASGMSDNSNELEITMFFSALTSTAWGIIFAIVFKTFTSGIISKTETSNKEYEIIASRVTDISGENYEI